MNLKKDPLMQHCIDTICPEYIGKDFYHLEETVFSEFGGDGDHNYIKYSQKYRIYTFLKMEYDVNGFQ